MKRRLRWALAGSLVLHAGLLVVWKRLPPVVKVEPKASTAVEFEFVERDAVPEKRSATSAASPSEPPVSDPGPRKHVRAPKLAAKEPTTAAPVGESKPAPAAPTIVARPGGTGAEGPSAPAAAAEPGQRPSRIAQAPATEPSAAVAGTAPRSATLLPRSTIPLLGPEPEPLLGRTVHNDPAELPDPAVLAAYEAERVKGRVEGWSQQVLARRRVESGVISYYFHDLRHRLEQVTAEPPPFVEPFGVATLPDHGKQAYNAWKDGAARYGATGSAYETPEGYRSEVPNSVQEAANNGSYEAQAFAQRLQAGARLRDFGDGRAGEELLAVVELRQSADGALVDLALIQPSSSLRFDAWVMAQAPKALDGLSSPPDAGVGLHPDQLRSIWAFKGRVSYKRDMRETTLLDDGWYLGLMAIPGLLTGNFDELSGKVDYVDLRHPHYECRVQLLEVY